MSQIANDATEGLVLLFKVLGNDTRLKILESLRRGEKSVGDICGDLALDQARVSHELRCLTACGFCNFRREGKKIIYSLNDKTVLPITEAAKSHVEEFGERIRQCELITDARNMLVRELTLRHLET